MNLYNLKVVIENNGHADFVDLEVMTLSSGSDGILITFKKALIENLISTPVAVCKYSKWFYQRYRSSLEHVVNLLYFGFENSANVYTFKDFQDSTILNCNSKMGKILESDIKKIRYV